MIFHIITLFPESFDSYINSSIIGRAVKDKKIKIKFYNPRDFTKDKWRRVDQKPYAGGPGMVLEAASIIKAVEKALKDKPEKTLAVWLSPSKKQFDNLCAEKISKKYKKVIIICGRYEGIDERAKKIIKDIIQSSKEGGEAKIDLAEFSVGPYILTGGELPAMIILDTVARRIPGVLGNIESLEETRTASPEVYTRPEILEYKGKKYRVPKILLSGNHKKIEEWKKKKK